MAHGCAEQRVVGDRGGDRLATDRYPVAWQAIALATLGAFAVVQARFIVNLTSQNGRILLRLEALEDRTPAAIEAADASSGHAPGLTIGPPAPQFSIDDVHGETVTLAALRAAKRPVMLIFSDPGCGPCSGLMPDIPTWQRDHGGRLTIGGLPP